MASTEVDDGGEITAKLLPCNVCGRTFLPEPLKKHSRVCEKNATRKRKVFNSLKQRVDGTELASFHQKSYSKTPLTPSTTPTPTTESRREKRPSTWKQKHLELVNTIRAAKGVPEQKSSTGAMSGSTHGMSSKSLTALTQSTSDRCPTCDRCFGPKAFDRHVEWCKEHKARIQKSPVTVLAAKERLEARTKYRVPPLAKSKRTSVREKYSPTASFGAPRTESATSVRSAPVVSCTSLNSSGNGGGTPDRDSKRTLASIQEKKSSVTVLDKVNSNSSFDGVTNKSTPLKKTHSQQNVVMLNSKCGGDSKLNSVAVNDTVEGMYVTQIKKMVTWKDTISEGDSRNNTQTSSMDFNSDQVSADTFVIKFVDPELSADVESLPGECHDVWTNALCECRLNTPVFKSISEINFSKPPVPNIEATIVADVKSSCSSDKILEIAQEEFHTSLKKIQEEKKREEIMNIVSPEDTEDAAYNLNITIPSSSSVSFSNSHSKEHNESLESATETICNLSDSNCTIFESQDWATIDDSSSDFTKSAELNSFSLMSLSTAAAEPSEKNHITLKKQQPKYYIPITIERQRTMADKEVQVNKDYSVALAESKLLIDAEKTWSTDTLATERDFKQIPEDELDTIRNFSDSSLSNDDSDIALKEDDEDSSFSTYSCIGSSIPPKKSVPDIECLSPRMTHLLNILHTSCSNNRVTLTTKECKNLIEMDPKTLHKKGGKLLELPPIKQVVRCATPIPMIAPPVLSPLPPLPALPKMRLPEIFPKEREENYNPFECAERQLMELLECTPEPIVDRKNSLNNRKTTSKKPSMQKSTSIQDQLTILTDDFDFLESYINDNFNSNEEELNFSNELSRKSSMKSESACLSAILNDRDETHSIDPSLINENDNLVIPDKLLLKNDDDDDLDVYSVQYDKKISTLEPLVKNLCENSEFISLLDGGGLYNNHNNHNNNNKTSIPAAKNTRKSLQKPSVFLNSCSPQLQQKSSSAPPKETSAATTGLGVGDRKKSSSSLNSSLKRSVSLLAPVVKTKTLRNKEDVENYFNKTMPVTATSPDLATMNSNCSSVKQMTLSATIKTEELFSVDDEMYEEYRKYEEMYLKEKEQRKLEEEAKSPPCAKDSAYGSLNRNPVKARQRRAVSIEPHQVEDSSDSETSPTLKRTSKFCHECGNKYPITTAKFCVECGVRRLVL